MDERAFREKIRSNMKLNEQMRTVLPQHNELLDTLNNLEAMAIGQSDRIFCNSFISEAIRLLINAIFLYEDGYFDCAFYSVRQAAETCNSMLYIANKGVSALKRWDEKNYFPMNSKLISQLSQIDTFYSQVKANVPEFFDAYEKATSKSNKIIHKQGFDTFYLPHQNPMCGIKIDKEKEKQFFVEFVTDTICLVIILYIVVDPISLVLADEELTMYFNFDPMSEPADMAFLSTHLDSDIDSKIKSTAYFKEFSQYFLEKEKMRPATFDVVRYQVFDLTHLDDIKSQESLLNFYEKLILALLISGIQVTHIHPDCFILGYTTSIPSNYQPTEWSSSDYDRFQNSPSVFNAPYHTIFRSIIKGPEKNWLLEHNIPFTTKEIERIRDIFNKFNELYGRLASAFDNYNL